MQNAEIENYESGITAGKPRPIALPKGLALPKDISVEMWNTLSNHLMTASMAKEKNHLIYLDKNGELQISSEPAEYGVPLREIEKRLFEKVASSYYWEVIVTWWQQDRKTSFFFLPQQKSAYVGGIPACKVLPRLKKVVASWKKYHKRVSTVALEDYTEAPSPLFFMVPDRIRKSAVKGDLAKMTFLNPTGMSERMWVEIIHAFADGSYEGVLTNTPAHFAPKVLKRDSIVRFSWNHICDLLDKDEKTKLRGVDAILENSKHVEALLQMWAVCDPLQPLDDKKCNQIARHLSDSFDLMMEIHRELGLNGGEVEVIHSGKGIEAALEAAGHLVIVVTDWNAAGTFPPKEVERHIKSFVEAQVAVLNALEPSTAPTPAALLKRLMSDEEAWVRRPLPHQLREQFAEEGIDPESDEAKAALVDAEKYAADVEKAMTFREVDKALAELGLLGI